MALAVLPAASWALAVMLPAGTGLVGVKLQLPALLAVVLPIT